VGSSRSNDGTDDHDEKLRQRRLAPPSQATQALAASAAQITAATVVLHHAGCSGCRGIGCAFSSQNTRRKSRVELSSSLSRPYSAEAILAPSLPLPVNTRSSCEPVYSPEKANSAG
jgi:hypothetical protein